MIQRTIFSNFSRFGALIFQIYKIKSATLLQGQLCFKGNNVLCKYGNYLDEEKRIPIEEACTLVDICLHSPGFQEHNLTILTNLFKEYRNK